MHSFASLAGRGWPLALMLAALGACASDEGPITAPSTQPNKPNLAVGEVITVTNTKGGTEAGSLRWAVAQATGGEIIRFDSRLAGSTVTLDSTLAIRRYLTIEGPADRGVTISGGGKGRVIDIDPTADVDSVTTLRNLSITGGKLVNEGGAGIRFSRRLALEHSTVWGNEAGGAPAILALPGAQYLKVVNSTVSGNTSTGYGYPAIVAASNTELTNSTIAYNSQGGISVPYFSQATLRYAIIANNGFSNCVHDENIVYMGTSISNDLSCGDSTDMMIADPKLESLRDNGGPSMTHAVTPESPAFNKVPNCGLAVDQRYTPRDAYCDIGAFESTDSTTVTIAIDRVGNLNLTTGVAFVTGTVACSRAGDQFAVLVQVQQSGPDKTVVGGSGEASVTCTTSAQPWSAFVSPSTGAFKGGRAAVTATTKQTPSWVAPATASRSIKLVAP